MQRWYQFHWLLPGPSYYCIMRSQIGSSASFSTHGKLGALATSVMRGQLLATKEHVTWRRSCLIRTTLAQSGQQALEHTAQFCCQVKRLNLLKSDRPLINNPPFKGLSIRIRIIISIQGRGFINHESGLCMTAGGSIMLVVCNAHIPRPACIQMMKGWQNCGLLLRSHYITPHCLNG